MTTTKSDGPHSPPEGWQAEVTLTLDGNLVRSIEDYLVTDWKDGRDPSKFGALNAVAFIGERVIDLYQQRAINARREGSK